ncbi:MAG TPA: DNA helicase RecG, partial [Syntrophaceae bacterium]|nr:DNA helicase RecG [Syntrophaceae bacterium]
MIHPDYEILDEEDDENLLNFKRIVPVYSETEGLHQKYIRKVMHAALENYSRYIASPIPAEICRKRNLINIREALVNVHFPEGDAPVETFIDARSEAHRRLIYDEFFFFQLGMAVKKSG